MRAESDGGADGARAGASRTGSSCRSPTRARRATSSASARASRNGRPTEITALGIVEVPEGV